LTDVLAGCRCTSCGASALAAVPGSPWDADAIVSGGVRCKACGADYDVIWGAPFLGHYESADTLGLLEIAANARADNAYPDRQVVERLEALLERYDTSVDKVSFVASSEDEFAREPWFLNRYTEYRQFAVVSRGVTFRDRDVLDVGAGTGYDAMRLARLGARVTALEYNPMLVARGRGVLPEARWVGGFAHVLPFDDAMFDVVCCNAALHHIRDIPAAIEEMLRVLRPGGTLLTTGDPFRRASTGPELELDVFDRHPAVLLGVNESIPPTDDLIGTLVAHTRGLRATLHVDPTDQWQGLGRLADRFLRMRFVPLELRKRYLPAGGAIAMRVTVTRPLSLERRRQREPALRAGAYAGVLGDYGAALRTLLPLLPTELVDRPFPGNAQTKFELLNGWRKPRPEADSRVGYRRARWFLTRPEGATRLQFEVSPAAAASASLTVRVDAAVAATVRLGTGGWARADVPLSHVRPAERFMCELELTSDHDGEQDFDGCCFVVRGRRFLG
jgi:SAM-dependent methyltransferase